MIAGFRVMKKKKKLHPQKSKSACPINVSEMIINYAGDYISLGDTIVKRQNYLNLACVAWNISLLDGYKRGLAIDNFLNEYKANNPGIENTDNLIYDLNLLIEEKLKLYPSQKLSILKAEIVRENEEEKIIVTSYKRN